MLLKFLKLELAVPLLIEIFDLLPVLDIGKGLTKVMIGAQLKLTSSG